MNEQHDAGRATAAAPIILFAALVGGAWGCHQQHHHQPSSPGVQNEERDRGIELIGEATSVVREIDRTGEIPLSRREQARCVVVVPSLVTGGLLIGAKHGRGIATCRTPTGWSAPEFVVVSGGTAGLQAGLESSDVVMLVMTDRGVGELFRSSFQLGADTSVAAGPVGKEVEASTNAKLTAEILSYAHTRGLFAGAQLNGAVMKQDLGAMSALYGAPPDVHALLAGEVPAPRETKGFEEELRRAFPTTASGTSDSAATAP
jgi:lipid-binding SYLF domain-containing protein